MELRFTDWVTNLLGMQSAAQFGARPQEPMQAVVNSDCAAYFSTLPVGTGASSVVSVKDSLAVIPEDWTASGVKSHFLNAEDVSSTFSSCLEQLKSHSFIAFDDAFAGFLGLSPRFETIHSFDGAEASHVHEAPVFIPATRELVFADTSVIGWLYGLDIETHKIRKIKTEPKLHNVNGGTYHASGLYVTTNGSPRRAVHKCTLPSKGVDVIICNPVVNNYRLAHLNSPNDLIFSSQDHILFTDPTYGWDQAWPGVGPPELPTAIYHFNMTSKALIAMSNHDVLAPNGLALSPDEKTLYVADSNSTSGKPLESYGSDVRNVYAFDFDVAGPSLKNPRLAYVCEAGWPDGLRVTESGLLLVGTMGGVDVVDVSRGGLLLGKINVGDDVIFNLEPARGKKFAGVWLLTGLKGIYKVTIAERHQVQNS